MGEDGPTHHGAFDLSFLRHIPNIKILAPRDEPELQAALITSLNLGQPAGYPLSPRLRSRPPPPNAEPLISLPPLPLGEGELLRARYGRRGYCGRKHGGRGTRTPPKGFSPKRAATWPYSTPAGSSLCLKSSFSIW